MHTCLETRRGYWTSCSSIFLRQGLSLNPELDWQPASPGNSSVFAPLTGTQPHPGFYTGAEDLNLGPHACATNTFPHWGISPVLNNLWVFVVVVTELESFPTYLRYIAPLLSVFCYLIYPVRFYEILGVYLCTSLSPQTSFTSCVVAVVDCTHMQWCGLEWWWW